MGIMFDLFSPNENRKLSNGGRADFLLPELLDSSEKSEVSEDPSGKRKKIREKYKSGHIGKISKPKHKSVVDRKVPKLWE